MTRNPKSNAFTIIELLVVVSIIVLLIAMLVPSLDRAKYEANLAVCGTNLRGIHSGMTQYALQYKRTFPRRHYYMPTTIRGFNGEQDIRPLMQEYFSIEMLLDPLCEDIDLLDTPDDHMVMSNYPLLFGYQVQGGGTMKKIGQAIQFTDRSVPDSPKTYRIETFAGDWSRVYRGGWGMASHADDKNVMRLYVDEKTRDNPGHAWVLSRYQGGPRGLIEMNFGNIDGGVDMYRGVSFNDRLISESVDERMIRIPNYGSDSGANTFDNEWVNLPRN